MNYFLHSLLLGFCIWLVGRKQPDQLLYYTGISLKLIAGIALGLIHHFHYYGGDTWHYYNAAKLLTDLSISEWWTKLKNAEIGSFANQSRAIFFTKIVSIFIFITKGDYWVVSSYFSFISFLAYWFFYRQIRSTLPNIKWPVVIGFLLFPSNVFWSAGILKGVLTNASVVFISAFSLKLFYRKKIYVWEIFFTGLCAILLYSIKYYLFVVLLPVVLYVFFDGRAHRMGLSKYFRGLVYVTLLSLTVLIAPIINPNLKISELPVALYRNQAQIQAFTSNESDINLLIEPTWLSLLSMVPKSTAIGLFGPSIFDSGSLWSWAPRLENLLIFILAIMSVGLLIRQRLWEPDILVIASLVIILSLATILPLASPNFGTLVRYRAPFTPFLVVLVTILPCWYLQGRKE